MDSKVIPFPICRPTAVGFDKGGKDFSAFWGLYRSCSTSDTVLEELKRAHRIIANAMTCMDAAQLSAWSEKNIEDGVAGELSGVRRIERRAVILEAEARS